MPRQPSATVVTGIRSLGNSSTELLDANETFTGEFEDVTDATAIVILIKSDKDSATNGLKFQWSIDGTEVDFEDTTNLGASAGLSGRAFSITPRGDFFRIEYINGGQAQTKFRLGVTYKSAGIGLITRPLDKVLTDSQFAQTVRGVIVGRKADGEYINILASDDRHLITNAVLYGVKDDGSIIPIKVTDNGRLRVKSD